MNILQDKEEKKRVAEEEKQKQKKERELKRQQCEAKKKGEKTEANKKGKKGERTEARKKSKKTRNKQLISSQSVSSSPALDSDDSDGQDVVCPICSSGSERPDGWVCCDICDTWHHKECTDIPVGEYDTLNDVDWYCPACLL